MQRTALVHEAYLRLIDQDNLSFQNRAHFAEVLGVGPRTIDRDWRIARDWLRREMTTGSA